MKKHVTILALLLCLTLTACGGEPTTSRGQDLSLEKSVNPEETAILLTVDGREVPAWRYFYWLAHACDQVQQQYEASGVPLDWNLSVPGGTLADYVKRQALADTVLYATVENWADQYGCIPAEAGQPGTALPDLGLDEVKMSELETVGQMYAALYDLYCTEGSPLAPTQEALAQFGETCKAITLNRILIAGGDDREAARQRAAEVFSKLNGAEDQASEFAALAAAGDDRSGVRTVVDAEDGLAPELLKAVQALEPGQCSGILESEEGFSILQRLETDAEALREEYFDHLLQTAAESAAVAAAAAYDEVDPAAFAAARKAQK